MPDTRDFLTEHRNGSTTLVSLTRTTETPQTMIIQKAMKQKKELLEWLSEENPRPTDLLRRLAKCSTPYARLFKSMAEELDLMIRTMRSEQLDDLDRESSLKSAKLEVEIQQQRERLVKIRGENAEIHERLEGDKEVLNKLNVDIDGLQALATYSLDAQDGRKVRRDEMTEGGEWQAPEAKKENVKLDNAEYQKLWTEQQELTTSLQVLGIELRQKQQQQLEEMKAYVMRKNPRFMTRV